MTDDDIFSELEREYPLPRAALLAATASRETLTPRLIADIDRYIADPANAESRPQRLFYAFHLFGEWREKAAYKSLCHVMRMPSDDLHQVMGDALTETGHRVLASVFDGDPQPLYNLILDEHADEFARAAGCEALAIVTARGELPLADAERFLRDGFDTLRPRDFNYVWSGWQEAIALLGLESLQPLVRRAFEDRIDPSWLAYRHFEADLRKAIADGSAALKGGDPRRALFGDTIDEIGDLHCFSEAFQRGRADTRMEREVARVSREIHGDGAHKNPYRHVGRNDPCPCGSGLKFKRCHGKT